MRILLTGGTGFFGKSILRYISRQEYWQQKVRNIVVLSRSPSKFLADNPEFSGLKWLNFHQGDILDPETLPWDDSFSHILHAAADSTLGDRLDPLSRYTQIVDGTRNMLSYAQRTGARRFLLTSSGAVYGPQPTHIEKITEDYLGIPDQLNPSNAYAMGKRAAEHLCMLYRYAYDIEAVIARCFAFVGPDLPKEAHFAIGNFIRDALHHGNIVIKGNGKPVRSYLDQDDLAECLLKLLVSGKSGEAYNVGSDQAISLKDLACLVGKLLCPGVTVEVMGEDMGSFRDRYVPSIAKTQYALGPIVRRQLPEAIVNAANIMGYRSS